MSNQKSVVVGIDRVEDVLVPQYQNSLDAGIDLTAATVKSESDTQITYGTGLRLDIPEGYLGNIYPRSSIRKKDLTLSNSVGVIDAGYKGEIMATFNKTLRGFEGNFYNIGDRICQLIIMPYPKVYFTYQFNEESDRGQGGFGSTGD